MKTPHSLPGDDVSKLLPLGAFSVAIPLSPFERVARGLEDEPTDRHEHSLRRRPEAPREGEATRRDQADRTD